MVTSVEVDPLILRQPHVAVGGQTKQAPKWRHGNWRQAGQLAQFVFGGKAQRIDSHGLPDPFASSFRSPGIANITKLASTLQQIVHRFQTASQMPIELVLSDSPPTVVTLGQQVHLRQVAQEAISNSLRHGHCRHIKVELRRANQHLQLRVADDGAGFDAAHSRTGQGLANIQARAVQLGGQLQILSQPGRGTEIILDIPLATETSLPNGTNA
jgi:signal transduction histidine kinase